MRKIVIETNRKVRNFTERNLRKLSGLNAGQAYVQLKENCCLPMAESKKLLSEGKRLRELIQKFRFPSSIPVRPIDKRHIWQFCQRWEKHLKIVLDKICSETKPIYLAAEVNKILRRRKSKIVCGRVHLMWYLDVYGEDTITPENIATAIIKFGNIDWNQVSPLVTNSKYSFNYDDDKPEVAPTEFCEMVEFIWAIPKPKVQAGLLQKLQSDIRVLEEFCDMWKSAPSTYNYQRVFHDVIGKLQTLPPSKKRVSLHTNRQTESTNVEPTDTETQKVEEEQSGRERNYDVLLKLLREKAGSDKVGNEAVEGNHALIATFSDLPDFSQQIELLSAQMESMTYVTHALTRMREILSGKGVQWK